MPFSTRPSWLLPICAIGIAVAMPVGMMAERAIKNAGKVEFNTSSFRLRCHAENSVSGVREVRLYFRHNAGLLVRWSENFKGEFGKKGTGDLVFDSRQAGGDGTYEFWVQGVDNAGNVEPLRSAPDLVVRVETGPSGVRHWRLYAMRSGG